MQHLSIPDYSRWNLKIVSEHAIIVFKESDKTTRCPICSKQVKNTNMKKTWHILEIYIMYTNRYNITGRSTCNVH